MAPRDPSSFIGFQQRFLSGQPQLNPVLDAFAVVLLRMWDLYDPPGANTIVTAVFEFVSICCIEPDIEKLPMVRGAKRFSSYVRHCTGVGSGFAVLTFPKSTQINIMEYLHAVPEMDLWVCLSNDVLSFVPLLLLSRYDT
jgi:Trichodiene synthase (TRI5)